MLGYEEKYRFVAMGIACLIAVAGCGGASDAPSLVEVKGTVLYKDKPISGASVTFVLEGSPISTGTTNDQGQFVLTTGGRKGAPIGEAKVGIDKAPDMGGSFNDNATPDDMMNMAAAGEIAKPVESEVPAKYANPVTSKLVASISSDASQNDFEFRLQD